MKSLAFVHRNDTRFAVGGFSPVLSVFSYHDLGSTVSPFLLLDHLGPGRLLPSTKRQGVHDHPHRGFETVTLVHAGELEHRDSSGGGGLIRAGDVQWMTAASGVIHSELFSEDFTRSGGAFEMIQLWVNLPAADKMGPPAYQNLASATIPVIMLPDGGGSVRVVAGHFADIAGAARTHTRINLLDVRLLAGHRATFPAEEGDTALVYLLAGRLRLDPGKALEEPGPAVAPNEGGQDEPLEEQGLAVFSSHGKDVVVEALENSHLLVLTGEPINEPINGHGPFVMNTYEEILQAYDDIKSGRFGKESVS